MRVSTRPPLKRVQVIDSTVRREPLPNARTLARELEVTPRTIQRDIEFMRDQLDAPLEFDNVRNGYYYTDPSYRLSYFQVTEGELVALLVSAHVMDQYRGTPFEEDLRESPRHNRGPPRRADQLPIGPAPRSNDLRSRDLSGSGKGSVSLAAGEHGLLDRESERNADADR